MIFRKRLIQQFGSQLKCQILNCGIHLEDCLIASHIKPVNKILKENISEFEKINQIKDIDNGLLLCRNHDCLFDKFLITFSSNGNLIASKNVINFLSEFNLVQNTRFIELTSPKQKEYLKYHWNVFAKIHHLNS